MAAREKTVVQGALIVCIIFLFFSLVGNYFLWVSSDANAKKAASATATATTATDSVRKLTQNMEAMKQMMGFVQMSESEVALLEDTVMADAEMAQIVDMWKKDMSLLGADVQRNEKSYHKLPEYFMQTLRQRNESVANDSKRLIQLTEDNKAVIKRETDITKSVQKEKDALQGKLQESEETLEKERAEMKKQNGILVDQKANLQLQHGKEKRTLQTKIVALEKDVSDKQATITNQSRKILALEKDEFQSAQGKVVSIVNTGTDRLVYINLGSADLLRKGIIFGVLDPKDVRISDAKPKARIEVMEISAAHLSVARIVEEKNGQMLTISNNDPIYSPFWEPKQRVKIALAGFLDLDGDGRDDQDQIAMLIQSAGAEVVAKISAKGIETGKLDFNTRFVVIGGEPAAPGANDPTAIEQQAAYLQNLGKFQERAKELGITVISLSKLMGWLRTLSDAKTVPLLGRANPEDFPPEPVKAKRNDTKLSDLYDKP